MSRNPFQFLGKALPIAGTIASFIPGGQIWGAGLTAAGGLLGGMDSQDKSNQMSDEQKAIYQQQLAHANEQYGLAQKYQAPLMDNLYHQATDFNPYSNEYLSPIHRANAEAAARASKQESGDLIANYAERGLTRDSSGLGTGLTNIGLNAGNEVANADQQAIMKGVDEQWNRVASLAPMVNGMASGAGGMAMGSAGGLGGIGAMYQSDANAQFAQAQGALSQIPPLLKRGSTPPIAPAAGNNTLATNKDPSNPRQFNFGPGGGPYQPPPLQTGPFLGRTSGGGGAGWSSQSRGF